MHIELTGKFFSGCVLFSIFSIFNVSHAYQPIVNKSLGKLNMSSADLFTQEHHLKMRLKNEITSFWQQGIFSSFIGVDNTRINYAYFNKDNAKQSIIIVNGRSESYLKYKELSYDLVKQGYNVFLLDHRGQGLSERLLNSQYKGYVNNFQDYVSDLALFIKTIVKPNSLSKPFLLAHSMGAAISTRYMQDHPNEIQAAVLSSPMFGFNAGGVPQIIAKSLIKSTNALNQLVDDTPWYFFGHHDYKQSSFSHNVLSHSELRYQIFNTLYEETPAIQLGGVSFNWLVEGMRAQDNIFSQLALLSTPLIVLQASDDTVIDNNAQDEFCAQLHQLQIQSCPGGKPIKITGAFHELFFEKDDYRNQALSEVINWFAQFNK